MVTRNDPDGTDDLATADDPDAPAADASGASSAGAAGTDATATSAPAAGAPATDVTATGAAGAGAGDGTDDPADGGEAVARAEPEDTGEGDLLVRANNVSTAVFTGAAGLAAALPDTFVRGFVPVSLVLFAVGCAAFTWAFAVGIGRSRFELVDLGGLFFLGGGVAPARVRRAFQLALAVQVVVAVAAAVARPFTPVAFGVLAPTLGVGLMALWGARHGTFPPRDDER
jgi:hypothetical protein